LEHLRVVFEVLKTNKLFTKINKCKFVVIQVDYLGHIVLDKGMSIDPIKIKVVVEWPILKNKMEVKRFLGLANYFRWFMKFLF
jgi:hypothetical protein